MNCQQFQDLTSAWIDAELPREEADRFQEHLRTCEVCRSFADEIKQDHLALNDAFLDHQQAARAVAERTLASLPTSLPKTPDTAGVRPLIKGLQLLAATAAGFLLAVLIFQPWGDRIPVTKKSSKTDAQKDGSGNKAAPRKDQKDQPKTRPLENVVELVLATGDLQYQVGQSWMSCPPQTSVSFPAGAKIRTGPKTQCELRTKDGCVVRLDGSTQVTVQSERGVELKQGKLWCKVSETGPFRVAGRHATATCKKGELDINSGDKNAVFTAGGETELELKSGRRKLNDGETLVVTDQLPSSLQNKDIVLATNWMLPLLMEKGHDSDELHTRVDILMARLGHSKISLLYESEIRSLGQHCVLPLTRYVQSPLSRKEPRKRLAAMRILSDLAPNWSVGDLIALLPDENPEVRVLAATALKRLTGVTQNRQPSQWRSDWGSCSGTHKAWQSWWLGNQSKFPGPPLKSKMKKS